MSLKSNVDHEKGGMEKLLPIQDEMDDIHGLGYLVFVNSRPKDSDG